MNEILSFYKKSDGPKNVMDRHRILNFQSYGVKLG